MPMNGRARRHFLFILFSLLSLKVALVYGQSPQPGRDISPSLLSRDVADDLDRRIPMTNLPGPPEGPLPDATPLDATRIWQEDSGQIMQGWGRQFIPQASEEQKVDGV